MNSLLDSLARPLRALRISVTDRCNLRCEYCMPEDQYQWLPRQDILNFEEISQLVDIFLAQGVSRYRITGGEPLLRRDLPELIAQLSKKPGIEDLALTTNGILLPQYAHALQRAGLHRLTISLDTLQPALFKRLTRQDKLAETLVGVETATQAGFDSVKLNVVVMQGQNDTELPDLLRFARERSIEIRFIEYMDVGGATQWTEGRVLSRADILKQLADTFGPIEPLPGQGSSPAQRYQLEDGTRFGVIASTTAPFCGACDRARLTADGTLLSGLYAHQGLDLRGLLREGSSAAELSTILRNTWGRRADQGAADRLREPLRGPLIPLPTLKKNPHLEMHTRGG